MTLLIGFGSRARQGKDSAAQAITKYYAGRNDLASRCLGVRSSGIKVGTFKFATALYQEVNEWLYSPWGVSWAANSIGLHAIVEKGREAELLPDWVRPEPNAEVSLLAPYGKHPKLLQYWGTDYRRAQDQDYWTKKTFSSIPKDLDIALITDVRFPNEFQGIKERGGFTVRVSRGNPDRTPFVAPDRPADHPSETALDQHRWDFELDNPHGHEAWLGEQAITLTEYLRGLSGK